MTDAIKNLTFYHYPVTRSARTVWAAYEVASCPVEVVRVDLYGGEQYSDEYLKKNPNHAVPALNIEWEDGTAQTLIESTAIIAFLSEAFPEAGMAPTALKDRATYLQMMAYCGTHMDMMLWQVRVHKHILKGEAQDHLVVERYKNKITAEAAPFLADRLTQGDYIAGPDFTLADCIAAHNILWARSYDLCQDDVFSAYLSRISKRPAFMRAFSDMGDFTAQTPSDSPINEQFMG